MSDSEKRRGSARVSLHRFGDCGALAVIGSAGTVYLDARATRALARQLARLARSLEREAFTAHTFKGEGVPAFANSSDVGFMAARNRGAAQ